MAVDLLGYFDDDGGSPVPDVTVQAVSLADGLVKATTTTDANGKWSFTGLADATYKIVGTTSQGQVRLLHGDSKVQYGSLNLAATVSLTALTISQILTLGVIAYSVDSTGVNKTVGDYTDSMEATASGITITLPTSAARVAGREVEVINTSTGSVTVSSGDTSKIGNTAAAATTFAVAAGAAYTFMWNGSAWRVR